MPAMRILRLLTAIVACTIAATMVMEPLTAHALPPPTAGHC